MTVFIVAFFAYVLMSIVLLLNLLIAMLSSTFANVNKKSTLEWRSMFARYMLKLELLAESAVKHKLAARTGLSFLDFELRVGEPKDDSYEGRRTGKRVHAFRDVKANVEGGGLEGDANVFEDESTTKQPPLIGEAPLPSASVAEVADRIGTGMSDSRPSRQVSRLSGALTDAPPPSRETTRRRDHLEEQVDKLDGRVGRLADQMGDVLRLLLASQAVQSVHAGMHSPPPAAPVARAPAPPAAERRSFAEPSFTPHQARRPPPPEPPAAPSDAPSPSAHRSRPDRPAWDLPTPACLPACGAPALARCFRRRSPCRRQSSVTRPPRRSAEAWPRRGVCACVCGRVQRPPGGVNCVVSHMPTFSRQTSHGAGIANLA
jgi:hypothetical protein